MERKIENIISLEVLSKMYKARLDWNNAKFNIRKPVSISISRKVGEILDESRAKEVQLDPHYRFYK